MENAVMCISQTRLWSEKTLGVFSSDARRISDNELRNRDAEMLEVICPDNASYLKKVLAQMGYIRIRL